MLNYLNKIIFRDILTGGSCTFDSQTNLPDANCLFIPSGNNSEIRSSYMAVPFLESTDHFCRNTETIFHHDIYKPTKHNTMCDYTSVWDIIMENSDFKDVKPMNTSQNPSNTIFKILKPESSGRFVLVLDRSGSMKEKSRLDRLKQSADRWLR